MLLRGETVGRIKEDANKKRQEEVGGFHTLGEGGRDEYVKHRGSSGQ